VKRVLFVTNGHGEAAIADRISLELAALRPAVEPDHLALVGDAATDGMRDVGPRRAMPSGGLIAMGNTRNLLRDLRGGLIALTWEQAWFLRRARGKYDAAVAVGDVYALTMALLTGARTLFVGSAKSVAVAPYGAFEARILARASGRFVRDEATACELRRYGVDAGVANAIVDLFETMRSDGIEPATRGFAPVLALFPGSRDTAYDDAEFLCQVVLSLAAQRPTLGAVLSIARGLDAERFAAGARSAGWQVNARTCESIPFTLSRNGRDLVRAWRGTLGPLLARATLVLGQAGTANEAAAAAAVPVVAFERDRDRRARWYRRRQQGLLGDALAVLPGDLNDAVAGVAAILDDSERRRRMGEIGRSRMGAAGGARRIAESIAALLDAA
jgi:uncharacterized protein (TIGR03492 family)